jgi:hypothetical protein
MFVRQLQDAIQFNVIVAMIVLQCHWLEPYFRLVIVS